MDSLPIRQQDNMEVATFHFINLSPQSDPTVGSDVLPLWGLNDSLNPVVLDNRTVRTRPN